MLVNLTMNYSKKVQERNEASIVSKEKISDETLSSTTSECNKHQVLKKLLQHLFFGALLRRKFILNPDANTAPSKK